MTARHTAILFFARTPEAERKAKRLRVNTSQSLALFEQLRARQLHLARATGLPVFDVHEGLQEGASFGERLSASVRNVFAHGYQQVLILGADCPQLRQGHLAQALQHLGRTGTVIGQDRRGGCYLLGFTADQFASGGFANLPWERSDTAEALCTWLDATPSLPELGDLNDHLDLQQLRVVLLRLGFANLLLVPTHVFWRKQTARCTTGFRESLASRGPPQHQLYAA